MKSVHTKLMDVQRKLKVNKNKTNAFGNYKYRNLEDILQAVKPLLSDNGLTLTVEDNIDHIGDRFYIRATATITCIETGEKIQATAFAREPAEKKGMDASQITGTASSYARKYCLNGLLGLDDNKDADDYVPEESRKTIKQGSETWKRAVSAFVRDGNFIAIEKRFNLSDDDKAAIKEEAEKND